MMRKKSARISAAAAAFLALFVLACGNYSTTSRTAKDIKSIHVPFFENQTPEPNLEITVTERIIQDLIDDNTLKVVSEDRADAILRGRITSFQNNPFSFNPDLGAEEYHVVIRVRVSLIKRETGDPIWADRDFSGDGSYFLEQVGNANTLEDAIDEAINEITERILNLTVQDW